MEATPKTQLKVGIFMVAGLATVMASIFMLGADKAIFRSFVRLHAHFEQVQGLAEGSVVSLAGMPIGNIEKIEFAPETNDLDVTLKIDERFGPKVTEGTLAEVRTQGALGDKFVYLIPGDPKKPAMQNGQTIEVAKATDIFAILSDRGKDTERVFDIINELHKMTVTINGGGRLEKIVSNMATASSSLKDASENAKKFSADLAGDGTPVKLKETVAKLDSVMTKLDKGQGTLGALINDSSLHEQLKGFLGGGERRQQLKSLMRTSIEKNEDR